MNEKLLPYIAVMALVTYLIRMIPLTLVKGKINSSFVKSFIYYVPYAVLSAMTIPAIFYSTPELLPSIIGFAVGIAVALFCNSLIVVALSTCGSVLVCELIIMMI